MAKVKRLIQIPEEIDKQVQELSEQTGMSAEDIYSYLAKNFFDLPTSVVRSHMSDLFRRMSMKA